MHRRGIFPGTFDPVTLGHIDVLTRGLHLFDSVIVAVARADRHHKQPLFSVEERIAMFQGTIAENLRPRVEVTTLDGLLVDFARSRGVRAVVRGLRFISDFEYEFQMATMNQKLWPELDTVFLMPTDRYSYVNSTLVKEIALNGGNLRGLVTPAVARRLRERLKERPARAVAVEPREPAAETKHPLSKSRHRAGASGEAGHPGEAGGTMGRGRRGEGGR